MGINMRIVKDISNFIFIEDKPEKADAILIPGGAYPELPEMAARLWRKSKQEIYTGEYDTECAFYCEVLKRSGVPENNIIPEDKSRFTAENAWFSKVLLEERGIQLKKAIICCKAFHARRCLMYYQLTFPETEFIIVPVKDTHGGQITKENWYQSEVGVEKVLGELQRVGTQFMPEFKGYFQGMDLEVVRSERKWNYIREDR